MQRIAVQRLAQKIDEQLIRCDPFHSPTYTSTPSAGQFAGTLTRWIRFVVSERPSDLRAPASYASARLQLNGTRGLCCATAASSA